MSRNRFERLCQGLSPVEREKLAGQVQLYPDDTGDPVWAVDQDLVGGAYQRLFDAWQARAAAATPTAYWRWAGWTWPEPGNDAAAMPWIDPRLWDAARDDSPWKQIAGGMWTAAPGTEPPAWLSVTDLIQIETDAETAAINDHMQRLYLNNVVTSSVAGPPKDPDLAWLQQLIDAYRLLPGAGIARQLCAGQAALDAITARWVSAEPQPAWQHGGLLDGIPIALDPDLAADEWKLVDPISGHVFFSGTIGPG